MSFHNATKWIAALALLTFVSHAAICVGSNGGTLTAHAISGNAIADDTSTLPDFDGDGTVGFGDFVLFAGAFGSSKGSEKYEARFDLYGDGEIGFADFVIFAQDFGKETPSPVVVIPDANLRAAIEDALGKASGAPITQAEMATLDRLAANMKDVRNLNGLESATNLTSLELGGNNLSDVSPLSGLINLTSLDLWSNNVTDLSPLSGLKSLRSLDLWDNNFTGLSALAELTNLTILWLGDNSLTDLTTLTTLRKLESLDLSLINS